MSNKAISDESYLLQAQRRSTSVVCHFEASEVACKAAQVINRKSSNSSVFSCGFVLVENRNLDVNVAQWKPHHCR